MMQTFLDNFVAITDAPAGIRRLRDLVLDLAICGRLVKQNPRDEPAAVGLASLRAAKGSTLAGSIRGGESTPRIPTDAECGLQPPPGWSMARLDDTGEYVNGLAFKDSDWKSAGIPIIRIQNLTSDAAPFNYADGPFPEDRMAHDGNILVSWSATLNAFRWHRGDGVINQHIFKVIPDQRVVTTDYLFLLLRHSIRAMAASEAAHGLVMKHINRGPFLSYVVAIPPLDEQVRIVAKATELAGLCDQLEARMRHHRRATSQLRSSALHAVSEAYTDDLLRQAWKRASENWPALSHNLDSIPDLRKTILNLAVRGLMRPRAKQGGWTECSFGDQITLQRGFDITKSQQRPGPYPVVSSGGVFSYHAAAACVGPGVVIGRKGSVGSVHWVTSDYWPHDTTLWVRDFHGNDPEYVYWFLRSFPLLNYENSTANPSLNRNRLHPVPILWPASNLQTALVKQIRQAFAICDRLHSAMIHRRDIAESLAESLLSDGGKVASG